MDAITVHEMEETETPSAEIWDTAVADGIENAKGIGAYRHDSFPASYGLWESLKHSRQVRGSAPDGKMIF